MSKEMSAGNVRRLAAILHADVVGYSVLMSEDEMAAQAAVSVALRFARQTVASHGGRLVGTAGDAFLAEFSSVLDAVTAAVEFQSRPHTDIDSLNLEFRIGVNLGDVIAEGDEIYGHGINVAARVQSLAPPGGIAITDAVFIQISNRLDVAFEDGGTHKVKNIAEPLHIYTASFSIRPSTGSVVASTLKRRSLRSGLKAGSISFLALIAAISLVFGWLRWDVSPVDNTHNEPRPVIAVLPFSEPGSTEAWFADGITEDVIAHLGRFPELLVLSWNTVGAFRNRAPGLKELRDSLGKELRDSLGARYVLHGSIRRNKGTLRISIEFSDARDGLLIWSKRFVAPFDDVFELQDQISGEVAGALAINIGRIEQRKSLEIPTESLDAYDLVLRGRAKTHRVDWADNLEARAWFTQAIGVDPDYADAHSGFALTHIRDVYYGWSEDPNQSVDTAFAATAQALELDPNNVLAMIVRAEGLILSRQYEAARSACDQALEINPNDSSALGMCGSVRVFSGESQAGIDLLELSLRINREPTSWVLSNLAMGYYLRRDYERGAEILVRGAHRINEDPSPHAMLAALNVRLGREEAARQAVEKTLRVYPFFNAEIFVSNMGSEVVKSDLLVDLRTAGFK